jgi:hypothetical protein
VRETRGPIPTSRRRAIQLQMSEKAEPKNDKITPAERSEHSPDPFGGGGWGVGVNVAATQQAHTQKCQNDTTP